MFKLLQSFKHKAVKDNSNRLYLVYALGEVLLVMIGILLALQVENWNQNRIEKQAEIESIEDFYNSFKDDSKIRSTIDMIEYSNAGEKLWLDFLKGRTTYNDTLLAYAYYIGATAFVTYNSGFYESLKAQGFYLLDNKELRISIATAYGYIFPEIELGMKSFNERFGEKRNSFFNKYFELDWIPDNKFLVNQHYFDYSMYKIKALRDLEKLKEDTEFQEFVLISYLFHQRILQHLKRYLFVIEKAQNAIYHELNYLKHGKGKKQKVTLRVNGFLNAKEVNLSGDFNNWQLGTSMKRNISGWEQKIEVFPGLYEYRFVIDRSSWILDPANPDSTFVPEMELYNSVLIVSE
jgi:hypothetical protein